MKNIKEFIDWYYEKDEKFFITAIENDTGKTRNYYHTKASFNRYVKEIAKLNTEFKKSLYFSINSFKEEDDCEFNLYDQPRKTKSNVKNVKSIVFDFDEVETSIQDCSNLIKNLGITPTYILQTSPKKFQVCYRLKDSSIDFKEYELVNKTLAKKFKSDINVCSIEKVFRLPLSINHKNGFQAMIKMFDEDRCYDFSMFTDKLKEYISSNEKIKEYYESLKNKNSKVFRKNTTKSKEEPKVIKKVKLTTKKSFKTNIMNSLDEKYIRKYKMLLKLNQNDASVADILYIKERSKKLNNYEEVVAEIISIRDVLNKPIKREYSSYFEDRAQFFYSNS